MNIKNLLFNKFIFPHKNKKDPRIAAKQAELKVRIQDAHNAGRYCFFENDFAYEFLEKCEQENDYERYMTFFDLIEGWDKKCSLSLESGEYVSNLWLADTNKIPAIHRMYLHGYTYEDGVPYSEELKDVMEEGLSNYGFGNQGGVVGVPDLSLSATPIDSFTGMINLIASYKTNNTTVLMQFPRDLVDSSLGFTSEEASDVIYDKSTGYYIIKPEYILGAIVKNDNGFDQFYSKEQLLSVDKKRAM